MARIERVVLVGHCGADSWMLGDVLAQALPDAAVEQAHTDAEVDALSDQTTLMLVNRVLDGRFAAASGVDLIRQRAGDEAVGRWMLISNYADAQEEAVAAGALPGFGKADAGSPRTIDLLRQAVAEGQSA